MAGFHGILTAALGTGTEVSCVTEHLSEGNEGVNLLRAGAGLKALNLAAAGVEIADNVAIYSSGTITQTFMIGSRSVAPAF